MRYTRGSLQTSLRVYTPTASRAGVCWDLPLHGLPERIYSLKGQSHMAAPMNGSIKRLVSDKGFGFILADDGNEYFFHNSACTDTRFDDLREGQNVTFEKGQGPKGPRAENVKVV